MSVSVLRQPHNISLLRSISKIKCNGICMSEHHSVFKSTNNKTGLKPHYSSLYLLRAPKRRSTFKILSILIS